MTFQIPVMGSTPIGDSENSFSESFDLRTLLCYLHFIQVTNPFTSKVCLPAPSGPSGWFSGIFRMKELEVIYSSHPFLLSRWKVY